MYIILDNSPQNEAMPVYRSFDEASKRKLSVQCTAIRSKYNISVNLSINLTNRHPLPYTAIKPFKARRSICSHMSLVSISSLFQTISGPAIVKYA